MPTRSTLTGVRPAYVSPNERPLPGSPSTASGCRIVAAFTGSGASGTGARMPRVTSPRRPVLDPLSIVALDTERHVAGAGWDQPPRLFALVRTATLVATGAAAAHPAVDRRPGAGRADRDRAGGAAPVVEPRVDPRPGRLAAGRRRAARSSSSGWSSRRTPSGTCPSDPDAAVEALARHPDRRGRPAARPRCCGTAPRYACIRAAGARRRRRGGDRNRPGARPGGRAAGDLRRLSGRTALRLRPVRSVSDAGGPVGVPPAASSRPRRGRRRRSRS